MNAGRIALVTGASGFTGSHLARRLARQGYQVRALLRRESDLSLLEGVDYQPVFGDLTDRESIDNAVAGARLVFHIAATFRSGETRKDTFQAVNWRGTAHVVEACLRHDVERLIHCSTAGVHGHIDEPPADEEAPMAPGDDYQRSKLEAEYVVLQAIRERQLAAVIFRPVGIHGPGDRRFLKMFRMVKKGRFILFGGGRTLYHLTYIDDLVDGIMLCAERQSALGRTYLLAGEECWTQGQVATSIAEIFGVRPPWLKMPVLPLYAAAAVCEALCKPLGVAPPIFRRRVDFFRKDRSFDITRAKQELGFRPRISVHEGLRRTAEWYQEKGWL